MSYRIEQDDSSKRGLAGSYTYRIYEDDRLIARYLHDFRGDGHCIKFVDGTGDSELSAFGCVGDFIEGGGPRPLRLSDRAVAYLQARAPKAH